MTSNSVNIPTLELLDACPLGVMLLRDGQVSWLNRELQRLTGLDSDNAKTPDPECDLRLRRLLGNERLVELRTPDADEVWLLCRPVAMTDGDGAPVELRFYTDVSAEVQAKEERDLLARKVEELELTDTLTGLANRRALGNALAAQVTRSRRYHNKLSLAMIRVRVAGLDTPLPDAVVLAVSRFLRERLRWADVIGRWDPDSFMLILPETGVKPADNLLATIRGEADGIRLPQPHAQLPVTLRTGLVQWSKGMDPARLVAEACEDLAKEAAA